MVFNARALHFLAVLLLAAAAVFVVDSAQNHLWANLVIGFVVMGGLLFFIWATFAGKVAVFAEPTPAPSRPSDDLRALIDQAPVPLIRLSERGGAQAVNRAARSLFQTDDLIVEGAVDLIQAIRSKGGDGHPILQVFGRQYAVNVSELTTDDGPMRLAALTDVQAEMHKAEAAALKDTLHILSHEIMNSLTPVASLAEIAVSYIEPEGPPDLPAAREALDTLSRRAASLTRFIDAYRSVARLPEPVFQSVEPAMFVQDIVSFFARSPLGEGVQLGFEATPDLPRLKLDEAQVAQAIINVVTNALEATEGRADRRVEVSVQYAHRNVIIGVADNGGGIDPSVRTNLFTAFATTKEKGTGTGLNLARQIALAQGGNLQLSDDRPGDMTTFEFTFPAQGKT